MGDTLKAVESAQHLEKLNPLPLLGKIVSLSLCDMHLWFGIGTTYCQMDVIKSVNFGTMNQL